MTDKTNKIPRRSHYGSQLSKAYSNPTVIYPEHLLQVLLLIDLLASCSTISTTIDNCSRIHSFSYRASIVHALFLSLAEVCTLLNGSTTVFRDLVIQPIIFRANQRTPKGTLNRIDRTVGSKARSSQNVRDEEQESCGELHLHGCVLIEWAPEIKMTWVTLTWWAWTGYE